MRIDVHIERLVLEGLPVESRDAGAIRAAVEGELATLLAERGLARDLASAGAIPRVSAPRIHLASPTDPATLGRRIARSVHGGIGR